MKKSVEIIGLPLISILEGKEVGIIKDLVINPDIGAVVALLVDDGKWYQSVKLLPFQQIIGWGEYAVTVEKTANIVTADEDPGLSKLLSQDVKVIGCKVLSNLGRMRGQVSELIIDSTGKIAACEMEETSGNVVQIPAQQILTFGEKVLIIQESMLTNVNMANPASVVSLSAQAQQTQNNTPISNMVADDNARGPAEDDFARKFEERTRQHLLGKKAGHRIEADNGILIVEQGGEITEEIIQKSKLAGKFIELSMSL